MWYRDVKDDPLQSSSSLLLTLSSWVASSLELTSLHSHWPPPTFWLSASLAQINVGASSLESGLLSYPSSVYLLFFCYTKLIRMVSGSSFSGPPLVSKSLRRANTEGVHFTPPLPFPILLPTTVSPPAHSLHLLTR